MQLRSCQYNYNPIMMTCHFLSPPTYWQWWWQGAGGSQPRQPVPAEVPPCVIPGTVWGCQTGLTTIVLYRAAALSFQPTTLHRSFTHCTHIKLILSNLSALHQVCIHIRRFVSPYLHAYCIHAHYSRRFLLCIMFSSADSVLHRVHDLIISELQCKCNHCIYVIVRCH